MQTDSQQNLPMPQAQSATSPLAQTPPPAAHADEELLDASWAHRVEVVLHTYGNDPHALAQQLAHLRAEYQQVRFGKAPLPTEEK